MTPTIMRRKAWAYGTPPAREEEGARADRAKEVPPAKER